MNHTIKFQALSPDAQIPAQGTPDSAGFDLYAAEEVYLEPWQIKKIPLGFATEMPPAIHCRIESRSGMALKGFVVLTGVIDADYRGEWNVILMNCNQEMYKIELGDRIAQAVFRPTVHPTFVPVEALESSQRGSGGFGSTGA